MHKVEKERSFEEDDKVTMVVTLLRIYELEWWTYQRLYWLEGVVSLASISSRISLERGSCQCPRDMA